jgi:UV DNA damage repair endonuclease
MTKHTARPTTPRLGLVCITQSDEVRYKTVTRKRLLQFEAAEQKRVLRELYAANLARLDAALDFCTARGLCLYRMTSGLFPFCDRHHSDLIEAMPAAYRSVPFIEVEAKHKELTIEKLRAQWLGARAAGEAAG